MTAPLPRGYRARRGFCNPNPNTPTARAPQVAWAQLQVLAQLALLLQHLLWSQTLAHWSLQPEDSQQLESVLLPRTLELLQAAAVAYWAAVTPLPDGAGARAEGGAALDPAQLVVALRIGDGPSAAGGWHNGQGRTLCCTKPAPRPQRRGAGMPSGGCRCCVQHTFGALLGLRVLMCCLSRPPRVGAQAAAKRARLAQGPHDSYVAGLLLAQLATSHKIHGEPVRVQLAARWVLGMGPTLHPAAG